MRCVILAAGQGTRLRPLTDHQPKCMVPLAGRPLIQWQTNAARSLGIDDIWIVGGFKHQAIDAGPVTMRINDQFSATNMVYSLWCAREALVGDVIISYSDIVCEPAVMAAVRRKLGPITVAVDGGWLGYWSSRFADPLADAETLTMDGAGRIVNIGAKAASIQEIQAQYIGLYRLDDEGCQLLKQAMDDIMRQDPARFAKMYMTDLLQGLATETSQVYGRRIARGWVEIDSPSDLAIAQALARPQGDIMNFSDSGMAPQAQTSFVGG